MHLNGCESQLHKFSLQTSEVAPCVPFAVVGVLSSCRCRLNVGIRQDLRDKLDLQMTLQRSPRVMCVIPQRRIECGRGAQPLMEDFRASLSQAGILSALIRNESNFVLYD